MEYEITPRDKALVLIKAPTKHPRGPVCEVVCQRTGQILASGLLYGDAWARCGPYQLILWPDDLEECQYGETKKT
jgi:hypothetical protein